MPVIFHLIESKTACVCRDISFEESVFPSFLNEAIDQSSFFFNPFNVIHGIDEDDEPKEFQPFLKQETPALEEEADMNTLQEMISLDTRVASKEIIGDISSENILTHRQRGVPELNLKEVDSDTLLFQKILKHPNKAKWMTALDEYEGV
jgi:hypothetical protein